MWLYRRFSTRQMKGTKMTPDQITQLRRILKDMCRISNTEPHNAADMAYGALALDALALLPCPTCNGTSEIPMTMPQEPHPCKTCHGTRMKRLRGKTQEGGSAYETCPDCQQHSPQTCPHGVIRGTPCRECSELYEKTLGPKPNCQ